MGCIFQGPTPSNSYLEPLSAPDAWWQGLPLKKVLVIAGADEIFVDDIQKFARQLSSAHQDLVMITVPGETHDHLLLEFMLNESRSQQRELFEQWLCEATCM
jgi:acetyl esterase/lipase